MPAAGMPEASRSRARHGARLGRSPGRSRAAAARRAAAVVAAPVAARARYIRRAAVAMLDELDDLALRLADETGWPRTQLVLSELLPAVRGLHALADDGPRALADRRLSPRAARLVGRSHAARAVAGRA